MASNKGDILQKLSPVEACALGAMTGGGAKMCNYPMLINKNLKQQGLPYNFNPRTVYRGLPIAVGNIAGTTATQFFLTGWFQKKLCPVGDVSKTQQSAAALLGGMFSGIPCAMWELTMVQQQRFGGSVIGVPSQLIREYGIQSLTRGMMMTMMRESLFTGAMLGMCPIIQRELMEKSGLSSDVALAAGALVASVAGGTVTHPIDTVKTCLQGDVGRKKFGNCFNTANVVIAESGVGPGLFRGLTWRVGLIATTFFFINRFKQDFAVVLFPHRL